MRAGTRIAVVGASSGLGRTIGLGLAERGAHVALLARRKDRLDAAVAEVDGQATAVRCDVTDPESCGAAIEDAARSLGGLDAVIYSTGTMTVAPLETVDAVTWADLFATNVIGASLVTAAALPHLKNSGGVAVYLSSISASGTPWRNIGSYVVSKAALDKLVDAWRVEQPDVRFTRLAVGDCAGGDGHSASEFLNAADPALAHNSILEWLDLGHMTGNLIHPTDLIDTVESIVTCRASMPTVTLAPPADGMTKS